MHAATAGLIGTAIGALSSGATAIVILLINKRSEERRQLRELAMKAAIENWHGVREFATREGGTVLPLEVFIVHMVKLSEILASNNLTADNLAAKLLEVQRFSDIVTDQAERYAKATNERLAAQEKQQSETGSQSKPTDAAPRQ